MKPLYLRVAAKFVACSILCTLGAGAHAATVVVGPGSMNGWTIKATGSYVNTPGGDGIADFVTGPTTPPLGVGSAHFNTGSDGTQSAQLRNGDWAGTRLDALTTLSYSTFATSWNGQQLPFLNLWLTDTSVGADRLWFEPDYTSPAMLNTWQTWDVLSGNVYSDSQYGPGSNTVSFAAYLLANPNAKLVNPIGDGGIRIASGFASSGDVFNAYVDNFSIGTSAGTTTYDFEPIPEPAFFQMGALIGMSGLGLLRLRKRTA